MSSPQSAKPFLKWAGGKNWLIKHLPSLLDGLEYNNYFEPFFGGGSIFFHLNPSKAFLSDINNDLINTYQSVRDEVDTIIELLKGWPVSEEDYYRIRSSRYETTAEQAARFIYLNRASFNGIYRVNRSGEYNVPYGKRDGYRFDYDRIKSASIALQGKTIECASFEDALKKVEAKDLVFLDPPYTVAHNNNGFIEYNQKLFSLEDQYLLKECIESIVSSGAYFVLTNAAHETIRGIFNCFGEPLELDRFSTLGGKEARRQKIQEYIFTNLPNAAKGGNRYEQLG